MSGNQYKVRLIDGVLYDPWSPSGKPPTPITVAWGLANLNRYGGHTTRPYSVAEHSIWVALYLACAGADNAIFRECAVALAAGHRSWAEPLGWGKVDPKHLALALLGLVHDAPEGCGLVDVVGPVLRHEEMKPYKQAHERCIAWLCEDWKITPPPWPDAIKQADMAILGPEMELRIGPFGDGNGENFKPWPGLALGGEHDLSHFGPRYLRRAWLDLYKLLRLESDPIS